MKVGDILFEKLKEKVKGKQVEAKEKKEIENVLMDWKQKLSEAMTSHEEFRNNSNAWDTQYNDPTDKYSTAAYMSNKNKAIDEETESNVNITMQLIEGSIDITVPKPAVSAIEAADGQENRKMIEGILTYMTEGAELQRIVSENERITKKNGMSVLKVSYNPDFDGRTYRGRLEVSNPHPVNFIPQPNIARISDMDYCFQIENKTIDQVCRTYGEEFRKELELEGNEYGFLEDFGSENNNRTDNMVSIIECWYKDKDDEVCLLTWADDTVIRDLPKFYYPRGEDGKIEEMETLEVEAQQNVPTQMPPGQQQNELGTIAPPQSSEVQVKRKVPDRFPFVLWYNIPKEKSIYGISDCQIVKRQQDSIKRLVTKEERKQNKGTTKIITRKGSGMIGKIKDAESQIIETDDPTGDVKVIDMKTPSNGMYDLYSLQLQAAKDAVGVTEASQGRLDSANMSGKALEALTANTAARLNIKTNEKYIAFRELYSLFYEFLIAYYDDQVPYRVEGAAEVEYGYFDKSLLLKQDITGEYYYPDFDIYINADAGMAKDKNFMIQVADKAMEQGAADAIDYWTIMNSINMPMASFILERARERAKIAEQQAQMVQQQQQDITTQNQNDIEGKADAVIKENEGLKKQLSKGQAVTGEQQVPQEQLQQEGQQVPTMSADEMAGIIAQLDPEEQKAFFDLDEQSQQQMLMEMESAQEDGGQNNG